MTNDRHSSQFWSESLIRKYDLSGPRYTSYPTAVQFGDEFSAADCQKAAQEVAGQSTPLSLYVHIPFCAHVCYYCACNKVITKHRDKAQPYLDDLFRDIEMQASLFSGNRQVEQLHWGGGTPTFISTDQMKSLMEKLRSSFNLLEDDSGDYSIEIDPREADRKTLEVLREIGFNRISLGVQDFNERVQKAVNRVQSITQTEDILNAARELGFRSINLDLIYGLPFQTATTFSETLERVIDMSPDRLSVFNYAHMPQRFMPQRRINAEDLPPPEEKLVILENSINRLVDAGYRFIGMDHFAKPTDELSIAQENGQLHRNFQGYTTHADCDLIAMGVSAISQVGSSYYQNHHDITLYQQAIQAGQLPVKRGVWLNDDDKLRKQVIMALICQFFLDTRQFSKVHQIDFDTYFNNEMAYLHALEQDGLISLEPGKIIVNPPGRLLIRAICKVFDAYIPKETGSQGYSRII